MVVKGTLKRQNGRYMVNGIEIDVVNSFLGRRPFVAEEIEYIVGADGRANKASYSGWQKVRALNEAFTKAGIKSRMTMTDTGWHTSVGESNISFDVASGSFETGSYGNRESGRTIAQCIEFAKSVLGELDTKKAAEAAKEKEIKEVFSLFDSVGFTYRRGLTSHVFSKHSGECLFSNDLTLHNARKVIDELMAKDSIIESWPSDLTETSFEVGQLRWFISPNKRTARIEVYARCVGFYEHDFESVEFVSYDELYAFVEKVLNGEVKVTLKERVPSSGGSTPGLDFCHEGDD